MRSLLRAPAFTTITILTLALGIGANTAIFSIVNGVILRPLGYPQPQQLMYLTTQFPAFGFLQFWVSPPEYFEFREINQSFSAVGAFTTGEANLTAGNRKTNLGHILQMKPVQEEVIGSGAGGDAGDRCGPPAAHRLQPVER